jgi:hypothetical protein
MTLLRNGELGNNGKTNQNVPVTVVTGDGIQVAAGKHFSLMISTTPIPTPQPVSTTSSPAPQTAAPSTAPTPTITSSPGISSSPNPPPTSVPTTTEPILSVATRISCCVTFLFTVVAVLM